MYRRRSLSFKKKGFVLGCDQKKRNKTKKYRQLWFFKNQNHKSSSILTILAVKIMYGDLRTAETTTQKTTMDQFFSYSSHYLFFVVITPPSS